MFIEWRLLVTTAYFIGGNAAAPERLFAAVKQRARNARHGLLVAFYGCINKSDKSLMLGPFIASQPATYIGSSSWQTAG